MTPPQEVGGTSDANAAYALDLENPATRSLMAHYATLSAAVRVRHSSHLDIAYGRHPLERFDLFLPRPRVTTVVVFFHGGWWKMGSKNDRAFIAPVFTERGIAFATVGYPFSPNTPLGEIARSAVAATHRVSEYVAQAAGETPRLILVGNSAGGHLAAYAASAITRPPLGQTRIAGLVGLSGLYDLEPLRQTYVNDWLGLSATDAALLSPIRALPEPGLPIILAVGEQEPPGFHLQMKTYARQCQAHGLSPVCLTVRDRDHFSIMGELTLPESELGGSLMRLALSDVAH